MTPNLGTIRFIVYNGHINHNYLWTKLFILQT